MQFLHNILTISEYFNWLMIVYSNELNIYYDK